MNALQVYSTFFIFLFLLFVFTACDNVESKGLNGVSSAKYRVRGQIVDAFTGKPVSKIKTVLGEIHENEERKQIYYIDSINTNERGEFDVYIVRSPSYIRFVLKIEEAKLLNIYEPKMDTIDFSDIKFENGSGWYKGEALRDLGQIKVLLKTI